MCGNSTRSSICLSDVTTGTNHLTLYALNTIFYLQFDFVLGTQAYITVVLIEHGEKSLEKRI